MINEFASSTLEYPLTVTPYVAFLPISNSPRPILRPGQSSVLCTNLSRFRHHRAVSRPTSLEGENRWVSLAQEGTDDCASALPSLVDPISR
ncbi:hypothetical protein BQ8794_100079 [Mesorhizobium prunaredense]|uniref:Uncharacterized protein n=1 Tax=Mesorhizobium prunaredense TaxID=1631249 RepID=A0A1R3UZX2_9HYPH|nr:hypothetical protein BQ8794_100079 [Mesorhizobium prunaredense]